MFYCEVVIYAGDIKYSYSIVKQYAWVLNTRMRDLPLKILDFCTLRKGDILRCFELTVYSN